MRSIGYNQQQIDFIDILVKMAAQKAESNLIF